MLTVHGHHYECIDCSRQWPAQGFKTFGVGLRGMFTMEGGAEMGVLRPGEIDSGNYRH